MVGGIKRISGIKGPLGSITTNYTLQSTYENFLLGTHLFNLYYGYLIKDAVAVSLLWPATFTSTTASTTASEVPVALTKSIDVSFNNTIQTERLVGGIGKVEGSTIIVLGTFLTASTAYVIAKLIKVSGGVPTTIGSTQSETESGAGNYVFNLQMDVTRTNFGPEDILRLTIEVWTTRSAENPVNSYVLLNHAGNKTIEIPFVNTNEY